MSPAWQFRYPPPPNSGVPCSIISLTVINQALGHPKMRFSGSRPTEFLFIPPPPNGAKTGFFHLVSPTEHFRYPAPLVLGVLSSIFSLILNSQALSPRILWGPNIPKPATGENTIFFVKLYHKELTFRS